ncbi:S9 family peptidase [Microbacterium sp. C7(2022)]|uniref:alpha/beta hydrolase family protein n=1 Tax=Microbacterium sp. C7(2022) TaxID=2992759 RepID=UPI00237B33AB|nr:S9 family peptidase [Microbacterium sp. C7(2022)]MDE0545586.1 S9 family peptidase [Microbacterium sp. C7(2022)]
MRARDIETLIEVGRPAIARDATFAVFATSRPDVAANRAVGQIWRIDLPDGAPRRLTRGIADTGPRVSPDGALVAFLRPGERNRPQIFVVSSVGGEPVQATDAPLGVSTFDWAPDGMSLAFTARVPEAGRYGDVEGLEATSEAPRRVRGIRWHSNGLGYTGDRPAHVFVVATPDVTAEPIYPVAPVSSGASSRGEGADAPRFLPNAPRQLTRGGTSYGDVSFTADGSEVLTVPDENDPDDAPDLRDRVVAVSLDDGSERELVSRDERLSIAAVAASPDGSAVLLAHELGESNVDFVAPMVGLFVVDEGGVRRLTDDSHDLGDTGSHVSVASDGTFLVQERRQGRVRLLRVSSAGEVCEVLGGDVEVVGHATAGNTVAVAARGVDSFGELLVIDAHGTRTVTAFGEAASAAGVIVHREVTIQARDGYPVHGWIATPAGEGPFPVILQIHGGPYAAYGIHLFDETQVLVDAGYAVVYCNPRGSAGYGRAHGRSIRKSMGTVDYTDVIDFLDAALASDSRMDADRVGIMGGSYGGYLTAWIIAHDHRFSAAIVERGFLDPFSFQGTSDIGSFFGDEYVGTRAEDIERQSPMAVVDQVNTPTLVMHSEQDYRCPLEQATRYFSALKRAGVQTEMLIFPGEDHELTRAGQPRHRIERFDAVLEWWSRYFAG